MGVKRPWNIVDMPVYSLATFLNGQLNMNVCTYVSAVSMKPKLFMVAIDYHTLTYERLEQGASAVLQILHKDQLNLVKKLGKQSGKSTDKHKHLSAEGLLSAWNGHQLLSGACGYLELKKTGQQNIQGDHKLYFFEVTKSKTQRETDILMFQDLIREGVIL